MHTRQIRRVISVSGRLRTRVRREGPLRGAARAFACALAVALMPATASAVTRAPVYGPPVYRPPVYRPLPLPQATVDHPPVDGQESFDNGSRDQGKIALTFDADMTPGMLAQLRAGQVRGWYNEDLRNLLDAEHIRATIFLTGLWAETYPDVARSLAADPNFELGDHTYDHAAFRTPCYGLGGAGDRVGEITHSQDAIAAITGVRPRLLRFPGDCYDRSDEGLAQQQGLLVISGDVRAGDAFNPNTAGIAATVMSQLRPGSIVVMHFQGAPNAPMTAPAVRQIIDQARARGLQFGTVSEVLALAPPPPPPPPPAAEVLARLRARPLAAPIRKVIETLPDSLLA